MWMLFLLACGAGPDPVPAPSPTPEAPAEPAPSGVEALPDPTEPRYAASHILIAWAGAVGASPDVARTPSEAESLAESLLKRLETEDFGALAKAHSDDGSAPRGGRLGVYPTGTMVPDFERAVASVEPGSIAPLVRTPFGWHIARRDAIEEITVRHILVTHSGSVRAPSERTLDEARTAIEAAAKRIEAGESFETVAKAVSEDEVAAAGGLLGRIARGQMVPPFEDAAFGLAQGETSGIVESPYGLHLIRRE